MLYSQAPRQLLRFPYTYLAEVISIYDADTIRVNIELLNIDVGAYLQNILIWNNRAVRLFGIDAPEIRGTERPFGLEAKSYVVEALRECKRIVIQTIKDKSGKYGRLLVRIWYLKGAETIEDIMAGGSYLNGELIELGLAEEYMA